MSEIWLILAINDPDQPRYIHDLGAYRKQIVLYHASLSVQLQHQKVYHLNFATSAHTRPFSKSMTTSSATTVLDPGHAAPTFPL